MPAADAADGTGRDAAPLSDSELVRLFAPLGRARRIALAVSGGADSLALLDAVDRWRQKRKRPDVVVLTVDHRLRAGSRRDAAKVRRLAKSRGLTTRVLVRKGPAPAAGLEAAARAARYALLFSACREAGASHLVVAHHRDDVAETFLMRLKRGAGVFGLAAMRPAIDTGGVTLVRLFLDVPRSRLAATTAAAGWTPSVDPMNDDPRLERTGVRRMLARGALDPALLAATARRFAELADTIDASATALIGGAVACDGFGVAWLDPVRFAAAPEQVRMRTLVRLLIAIGGEEYPPRYKRLTALHDAIAAHTPGRLLKRTLGGVVAEARDGRIAFYRETGRSGLPILRLRAGESATWDRRFRISLPATARGRLRVAALGEEGRQTVRRQAAEGLPEAPRGAVAALPAVWRGTKIVGIPRGLGCEGEGIGTFRCLVGERLSRPPLFPEMDAD